MYNLHAVSVVPYDATSANTSGIPQEMNAMSCRVVTNWACKTLSTEVRCTVFAPLPGTPVVPSTGGYGGDGRVTRRHRLDRRQERQLPNQRGLCALPLNDNSRFTCSYFKCERSSQTAITIFCGHVRGRMWKLHGCEDGRRKFKDLIEDGRRIRMYSKARDGYLYAGEDLSVQQVGPS